MTFISIVDYLQRVILKITMLFLFLEDLDIAKI